MLGERASASAWAVGQSMSEAQAVALALPQEPRPASRTRGPAPVRQPGWPLSDRELALATRLGHHYRAGGDRRTHAGLNYRTTGEKHHADYEQRS
jgi:hypothetical protein